MARSMNANQVAAKWSRNLGAATQSITAGVQAVTVNPAQRAAARQDAYLQGVQAAVASGKWQRGLSRVSLQDWQNAMIQKGVPRITAGANAAMPKMEQFMAKWLPYMDGLRQKLAAMPRGDLNANIQRAVAAIEYAAAFKYTS